MAEDSISNHLRQLAAPVWEAQHTHPFVRGIGDGTLDLDKFRFWVRQDYLFLIEYCRVFALGAARAPDLDTMTRFAALLDGTLRIEMDLHRQYAAEFGIGREELEREAMAPACRAYTDFLVRVSALGDFTELLAALLPCMWGFAEIGQRLAQGSRPADARYAAFIDMYASSEFEELAAWCRGLLDRHAGTLSEVGSKRVEEAFVTSSRHELAFWEMGWRQETWAV